MDRETSTLSLNSDALGDDGGVGAGRCAGAWFEQQAPATKNHARQHRALRQRSCLLENLIQRISEVFDGHDLEMTCLIATSMRRASVLNLRRRGPADAIRKLEGFDQASKRTEAEASGAGILQISAKGIRDSNLACHLEKPPPLAG